MATRRWFGALFGVAMAVFLATSASPAQESPFENGEFWTREGLFLHYRIWYPKVPQGKVLCIHGLGGSTFSWRYAPDFFLPAGYLVVAVDLPGFGYSARPVGTIHKPENRALLLLDFLRYLDGTVLPEALAKKRWCLIGHSMGGAVAFLMAMEEPERFQGVTLIAPALQRPLSRLSKILTSFPPARGCWITLIRNLFLSPSRIRRFLEAAYGRKVNEEEFKGYSKPLRLPGTARSLLSMVNTASSLKLSPFQGKSHPPFLLIWGRNDRFVPAEESRRFQEIFPDTPLSLIKGASHCPMETHPREVYPLILEFFTVKKLYSEASRPIPSYLRTG
ncbi:MAG: alpha/beta fold hydrolase [Candidatus Caldatribacteriaceae bacterium]